MPPWPWHGAVTADSVTRSRIITSITCTACHGATVDGPTVPGYQNPVPAPCSLCDNYILAVLGLFFFFWPEIICSVAVCPAWRWCMPLCKTSQSAIRTEGYKTFGVGWFNISLPSLLESKFRNLQWHSHLWREVLQHPSNDVPIVLCLWHEDARSHFLMLMQGNSTDLDF